jgi:Sulfite exporter TauE/SafE
MLQEGNATLERQPHLGVLIQKVLPNWLYLLIAELVLGFKAYKTYTKFFATRKKEQGQSQHTSLANGSTEEDKDLPTKQVAPEQHTNEVIKIASLPTGTSAVEVSLDLEHGSADASHKQGSDMAKTEQLTVETPPDESEGETTNLQALGFQRDATAAPSEQPETVHDNRDNEIHKQKELEQRIAFLEEDMRQYPIEKIIALIFLWIGLFILTLMKGGKGVESIVGIYCESPIYYILIVCQFLWMFGFALYFGCKLHQKQLDRVAVKYPYLGDDPTWDISSLKFYGGFTFVAGIVAGLIGVGGGMVLGPLMLVMGIHPRVSSATTATLIVLTSSSVAVMFVTSGMVPWDYAVFYFSVCFAGALVGKNQIDAYVKRTGRASMQQ